MVNTLRMTVETHFEVDSLAEVRQFVFLLLDPNLMEYAAMEEHHKHVLDLFICMTSVPEPLQDALAQWFQNLPADQFETMHHVFHMYITIKISHATVSEDRTLELNKVFPAVKLLGLFHRANATLKLLPPDAYYNDAVNKYVNMDQDYRRWRYWDHRQPRQAFSFCKYSWILNAESKAEVIQVRGSPHFSRRPLLYMLAPPPLRRRW